MKILVVSSDSAESFLFTDPQFIRVTTGVGLVNAAIHTSLNIAKHDPDLIINVGTCGAREGSAEIGDVFLIKDVINRDQDLTLFHLPQFATLSRERATEREIKISSEGLSLASSDAFQTTTISGIELYDMEGYSVAKAARAFNKRVMIIKGVTDIVGKRITIKDYKAMLKLLRDKIYNRALELIEE